MAQGHAVEVAIRVVVGVVGLLVLVGVTAGLGGHLAAYVPPELTGSGAVGALVPAGVRIVPVLVAGAAHRDGAGVVGDSGSGDRRLRDAQQRTENVVDRAADRHPQ